MQNHLSLEWADGEYDFRLTWAGAASVEQAGDASIQVVYERMMLGQARLGDVSETIRQGLLGGAGGTVDEQPVETKASEVNRLIERYVTGPESMPFAESCEVAKVIMHTFMVGYEPAQKKSEAVDQGTTGASAST